MGRSFSLADLTYLWLVEETPATACCIRNTSQDKKMLKAKLMTMAIAKLFNDRNRISVLI